MQAFKNKAKAVATATGIVSALKRQIEEKGEEIRLMKENASCSTRELSTGVGELLKMKIRLAKMAGETVKSGQTRCRRRVRGCWRVWRCLVRGRQHCGGTMV